jgi:enoyl-CoA hydratase/carnithine racemase
LASKEVTLKEGLIMIIPQGKSIFNEGIELLRDGGLIQIFIAREDDMNRINWDVLQRLLNICNSLKEDPTSNVCVISGKGPDIFSFGLLNPELRASLSKSEVVKLVRFANEVFNSIESLPQITIAAINGKVIAGGFELALSCDLRYAARHSIMRMPEASWGGFPGAGAPVRLPMIVGAAKAIELICTCSEINAPEMERLGIVQAVYNKEDFMNQVLTIAQKINANGPLAIKGAKNIIRQRLMSGFNEASELSKVLRHSLEWSDDVAEGISAHSQKRIPQFKGY